MSEDDKASQGGEVVFAGHASWSMVGKNNQTSNFDGVPATNIVWGFHRLRPLVGIKISKVISGPVSCACFALGTSGEVYAWGRNSTGQLGLGHTTNIYNPTLVEIGEGGERIVEGACGSHHSLLVSSRGNVWGAGSCKNGELGLGRKLEMVKKFVASKVSCVVEKVACGREFSMAVDSNGVIYSCGHPEFGCLGNGTESKKLERAGKFTFDCVTAFTPIIALPKNYGDVKIVDVKCGAKHTCAMDSEGRIYTWGFGAYGRLGHKDNKNQFEPMAVEEFSREPPPLRDDIPKFMQHQMPKIRGVQIACGSTATFVVTGEPTNALYMFGITKKSGEAVMYPTVVDNVHGWRVRSVSCGKSSVAVASERSLITWGPSPTFGELGYGEEGPKSSTVSKEAPAVKGCLTLQVASGMAHTLALIDMSDSRSVEKVETLPVFEPPEVDPKFAKKAASGAPKGKQTKGKKKKNAKKDEEGEEEDLDQDEDDSEDDDGAYVEDDNSEDSDVEEEEEEEEVKPKGKKRKAPASAKRGGRGKARKAKK